MGLKEYAAKRDFKQTAEPGPKVAAAREGLRFVVQKHAASHLHYDFRLEMEGVLKSWAVPKGPSMDPAEKRLAVHVEDHPVAYADFEGTIPQGQYGGGTVMLWDEGTWESTDADAGAAYRAGRMHFTVHGKKLRGGFTLSRMQGGRWGEKSGSGAGGDEAGKNWLLIKRVDESAVKTSADDGGARSVRTKRTMEEIAGEKSAVWNSNRADGGGVEKGATGAAKESAARTPRAGGAGAAKRATRGKRADAKTRDIEEGIQEGEKGKGARGAEEGVKSGRSPARRAGAARVEPAEYPVQLCTLAEKCPVGDDWVHEIKFDGYRLLAFKDGAGVRLITRNGKDWTHRFAPIASAVGELKCAATVVDGEAVILDEQGKPSFQALQKAIKAQEFRRLTYYAFDVLALEGEDVRARPLLERKAVLERLVRMSFTVPRRAGAADASVIRYSEHITGSGSDVQRNACRLGLEGVVCKRAGAAYTGGRSRDWVKVKCGHRQEFVIIGFTPPEGARSHFGSLLLGAKDERGKMIYTGRAGTGFDQATLKEVMARMRPLIQPKAPLDELPSRAEMRGATWIAAKLVAEVAFTEWTDEGRLRHPVFQGLREDKEAASVKIEKPKVSGGAVSLGSAGGADGARGGRKAGAVKPVKGEEPASVLRAGGASRARAPGEESKSKATSAKATKPLVLGVSISSPDRLVYPAEGVTKLEVAEYYALIAPRMLPYVAARPLSTVRCPGGSGGPCFFQKHVAQTFAAPVKSVRIVESAGPSQYITVDSAEGLVTLAQFGVLEMHPWGARNDDPELPDTLIFDLDPGPGIEIAALRSAALDVRAELETRGLKSFLKTSGGKGFHVVAPITRGPSWDDAKAFAREVAETLAVRAPEKYVSVMAKAQRPNKVFIDYLRNGRGATSIAPYSTRARPGGAVSMPLTWDELPKVKSAAQFTLRGFLTGKMDAGRDPWAGYFKVKQRLPKVSRAAKAGAETVRPARGGAQGARRAGARG